MGEDTVPEVFRPHLCVVRPARKCFLPSFLAENIPYLHFFFRDLIVFHFSSESGPTIALPCQSVTPSHFYSLMLLRLDWCDAGKSWIELLDFSMLLHGFVNFVIWICQIGYMDLLLQYFSPFSFSVLWILCGPKCIPHFPSLVIVLFPRQKTEQKLCMLCTVLSVLVFVHSLLFLFASLLELFPWEKRKDFLLLLLMEDV